MDALRLGILFSTESAHGALGRDCRHGSELVVEHLREEGAVEAIRATRRCDEATAHRFLRREAMRRRLALEQIAAAIVAGGYALPEVG